MQTGGRVVGTCRRIRRRDVDLRSDRRHLSIAPIQRCHCTSALRGVFRYEWWFPIRATLTAAGVAQLLPGRDPIAIMTAISDEVQTLSCREDLQRVSERKSWACAHIDLPCDQKSPRRRQAACPSGIDTSVPRAGDRWHVPPWCPPYRLHRSRRHSQAVQYLASMVAYTADEQAQDRRQRRTLKRDHAALQRRAICEGSQRMVSRPEIREHRVRLVIYSG